MALDAQNRQCSKRNPQSLNTEPPGEKVGVGVIGEFEEGGQWRESFVWRVYLDLLQMQISLEASGFRGSTNQDIKNIEMDHLLTWVRGIEMVCRTHESFWGAQPWLVPLPAAIFHNSPSRWWSISGLARAPVRGQGKVNNFSDETA